MPPYDDGVATVAEDDSFLTVEEIIFCSEKARFDFSKMPEDDPEILESLMKEVALAEFRDKFKIPAHVDLVPVGRDVIKIHRPGYCAFYAYPFHVDYSFHILPLAKEFCRYYRVYMAQLSPYTTNSST